jgi:hypothetical protein
MSNPRQAIAAQVFAALIAKNSQTGFDREQITATARQSVRATDILLEQLNAGQPASAEAPAAPTPASQESSDQSTAGNTPPAGEGSILEEVTGRNV